MKIEPTASAQSDLAQLQATMLNIYLGLKPKWAAEACELLAGGVSVERALALYPCDSQLVTPLLADLIASEKQARQFASGPARSLYQLQFNLMLDSSASTRMLMQRSRIDAQEDERLRAWGSEFLKVGVNALGESIAVVNNWQAAPELHGDEGQRRLLRALQEIQHELAAIFG